jgi:hypothetical protein
MGQPVGCLIERSGEPLSFRQKYQRRLAERLTAKLNARKIGYRLTVDFGCLVIGAGRG